MSTTTEESPGLAIAPSPPSRTLGLSQFDVGPVTALVRGDASAVQGLIEDTRQLAEALAGSDGPAARKRLAARSAAALRSQVRVVDELLAQRLAARDMEAVRELSRVGEALTRRLTALLKVMVLEESLQRPAVVIGNAERVAIGAVQR